MCTDENNDKNKMNKMNLSPSSPPHLSTPVIVLLIAEKKNN